MSLPILIADRSSSRAGGTSVEDEDDEVVATIPIKVPLPTLAHSPETATIPVAETTPVLSDVELLSAFVQRRDPAAFTQIVERYGPMVYRVAIRAVDDTHLADDVFQATFLVLAQSAHKIRSGEVLPAWLHGTARNIARRVFVHKATERRQLAQLAMQTLAEKGGEMTPSTELDPFDELVRLNEQQLLDEELQQLPEASRAPLVLFYLEGKTQAEIAQQMGLSVEAIEGRLRRAKQELRQRLIRRGVFLSTVVAAATVLTPSIACAAPASTLVSATLASALGTTAVGTSLLGGTAASTTLTTGATTAAQLAAQEVAAMSAASKATAIFLTTAASTTVATGLLFGAIAGSLLGVPGLAPALSDSPTVEIAYPLNLVREVGEPDPFALEREQPVLLALVEPDQLADENRPKEIVYQVADLNADSLKWVRQFVEANSDSVSVHEPTQGLVVRATPESHLKIREMLTALRNQQAPSESEVALDSVPGAAAKEVGDAAQDQTKAALPAPAKTGLIKTVRKDRTNRPKYVELTQGSNDGLAIGHFLDVVRRDVATGNVTLIGRIQVISVEPDSAVAEVVSTPQKEMIEAGDTVSSQLGDELMPAPEPSQLLDNKVVKINTPESLLRMVLRHSRKLTFPTKITTVEGFDDKVLTIAPLSANTIQVVPEAVGETTMTVTCESGKEYRIVVLVNTPVVHALHDELVQAKDAEIAKWQQSYRVEQVEKEEIRDELSRVTKEYNERITRLNQIVDFQRQRFDELAPPMDRFPFADGKITTVDNATGTVWLNIGRKNGLRTQLTFSVYDKTLKGLGRDPKDVKAKIEVVEVRDNSSIARVVEEERDRPIAVDDEIFSPAWCEGLPEHFAVVGNGDLNGDGMLDPKDRKILTDLLVHSGATLEVEITDDGQRLPADGKLTVQTKWLIVGDVGDPTTALNDPEKLKRLLAVQKQHEMLVQEAREHGIRIVSLKDFLTYMGWKPESRVYLPGGGVPFNLKPGANPPALNELAQAPVAVPQPAPITDEMSQFLTEWDTQNQKITTLESLFTRFEFDEVFGTETRSTGKFYLERPDRWRIDFEPADAALLAKPAGRRHANGTPYKVKPGESSKWICTGKRLYILDVANKAYVVLDIPPQGQGGNQIRSGLPHAMGGPLPFLFFLTAEDAKQLFTLRFGEFHNPLGDKLDANGKPRRKAIHVMANPVQLNMAKFCSPADVIFDADTYLPLNLRTIDPSGNKETVYGFDQSKMKVGVKWELKSPFHEHLLPGWKQTSLNEWPIEFPTMEAIFKGMLAGHSVAPPQQVLAQAPVATEPLAAKPVSVAKTIPITNPETEVELAVHEIRLFQFPVAIAKAEVQYDPVLEVEPVRGQLDTLHLRAIMDGRCLLTVTGANDAVYRVGITAGTPPKHRFRELDPGEEKALRALQEHVSLEFPDNSLKDICRLMTAQHSLPFTLDTEALKAAGADPDLHVSITAQGLTLAQALTTMLEKVKEPPLDYYVDGGTVHISTVAAMKERERLVYYRLASLSPEGQAAAEKYITPLAISVAPLEGDLLVDASVYAHKKIEEYLHEALRLESQRPARAIPLGSSARSNRSQGTISPAPRTSPPEGSLPNPPATVPTSKLTVDPQLDQIGLQLLIFEADEAAIAKVTTKANPKSATRELVEGFGEKSNDLLRDHQAKILTRPKMYTFMGQPSQIQVGHVVPVTGDDHAALLFTSLPAGVSVQLTPRQRTREGGLLLEYQIEISTRDVASEVDVEGTSVSTVSGRTLRGFATLPAGHTDGILIGPVDTVSRSENDQPARNVSTYLWMREEVDNPIPRLPGPTNRP